MTGGEKRVSDAILEAPQWTESIEDVAKFLVSHQNSLTDAEHVLLAYIGMDEDVTRAAKRQRIDIDAEVGLLLALLRLLLRPLLLLLLLLILLL